MKPKKNVTCKCSRCNKPFKAYTEDPHPLCRACKNSTAITKACKSCGKQFRITYGEQLWYESKNLAVPARCPTCRRERKNAAMAGNVDSGIKA